MTARILNCTEREYFSDPCDRPSLSASVANVLVTKSPLHAWCVHPKLGKQEEAEAEDTKAMIEGKVIHRLILGKGEEIVVCPFNDFRSNAARAMRDEAVLNEKVPVIEHRMAELSAAADLISAKLASYGYVFDGESEVAYEWEEDGERGPVLCRGRMDHVRLGDDFVDIYDLKKIVSADPLTISRHLYDYAYEIQHRAYTSCMAKLRPDAPETKIRMTFLFMEVEPPYAVTDVVLPESFLEIGRLRWDRAVLLWERCLRTNCWPEYRSDRPLHVEPQPYVLTREIGNGSW